MAKKRKKGSPDGPGDEYPAPYELWNFGYGKDFAFPAIRRWKTYLTVLTEFRVQSALESRRVSRRRAAEKLVWWVPTLWQPKSGLTFIPFVVKKPLHFDFDPKVLIGILQQILISIIGVILHLPRSLVAVDHSRFRVAFPIPDPAMHYELDPYKAPDDPKYSPEAPPVENGKHITVIAVIDDGLPFAHRNFRNAKGKTRVEYCWLQSVKIDEKQKTVLFGREYDRKDIDALIAKYANDEDQLYRAAGATRDVEDFGSLIDRHATHGAHVMDLATGYAPERGDTPREEIRIIAVQLPNTIAWDTSGFGKDMYMLSAFHYIFNRADIIAKKYGVSNLRLVINFSYGFSGGRHDGGLELEAAIDELVEKRRTRYNNPSPTALVVPAGNTFLERMHGMIAPTDGQKAIEVRWRIQPNDRTPSYLELWFGEEFDPTGYAVEVWDPWADRPRFTMSIEVDQNATYPGDPIKPGDIYEGDIAVIGQVTVDYHRRERWRVVVILAPTEPEDICHPHVPSGEWKILIKGGDLSQPITEPVHCWIQRSADPESLRSGSRQSYFDDLRDCRYTPGGDLSEVDTDEAFVRRFGSLNGIATGSTPLVVGGYRLGAGLGSTLASARPARYSSAGPLKPDWLQTAVDCSSMSDRSRALPGTVAAGVRSGSRSLLQGTSVAAPFVARQLAEAFATADDSTVWKAECENYLPLLSGYPPKNVKGDRQPRAAHDDLTKARLGKVRVPPHWQPGIEPYKRDRPG